MTYGRQVDVTTRYLFGNQLAIALKNNFDSCTWFATQAIGYLLGVLAIAVHSIHLDKAVTRKKSCLLGRHTFVEFVDVHIAITIHDDTTHTAVLALCHATQFIILALGNILGIWIHLVEHIIDTRLDEIIVVERIHIVDIQLTHHIGVDSQVFVYTCCLRLS